MGELAEARGNIPQQHPDSAQYDRRPFGKTMQDLCKVT